MHLIFLQLVRGSVFTCLLVFLPILNTFLQTITSTDVNPSQGLINFTSKDPQYIILEMYRIRQRLLLGESIEMPLVTITFWESQITGFIIDLKSEKNEQRIAIQLGGYANNTGELYHAYLGAVRGVVVHDIERYEHVLTEVTDGTKMNKTPSITKMEVRRRLDQESKILSEKTETSIAYAFQGEFPEGAMPLFVICNLITDVTICLKELALTDIGKQAIAGITKITFDRFRGSLY